MSSEVWNQQTGLDEAVETTSFCCPAVVQHPVQAV
jgi:hypothetical protein